MVISHKHKYIFIQLPRTGSTAIASELIENYNGEKILEKHSTYRGLIREYGDKYEDYYIFSSIRNPIDRTISLYLKLKKEQGMFGKTEFRNRKKVRSFFFSKIIDLIKKKNYSLSEFFLKIYRIPYDDWSSLDHHKFDYIIRYENIQNDFSAVLNDLNITQIRPIPVKNKTKGKDKNKISEINNSAIKHIKKKFGPFMAKNNYNFPELWGDIKLSKTDWFSYYFWCKIRKIYWNYIRRI